MFKKIFLVSTLVTIVLCVFFWESVVGGILRLTVCSYCSHHFENELVVDKIHYDNKYWVFENARINHQGALLSADRLKFNLGMRPFERVVDIEVIVEKSKIALGEEATNLKEVITEVVSKTVPYWLLKLHTVFVIEEGTVSWHEKIDEKPSLQKADFSFVADSKRDGKKAAFSLYLDGKEENSNTFKLTARQDEENTLHGELVFTKVDCCKMARVLQVLGHPFHGWEIYQGNVDGKIQFQRPDRGRAYAWGDALAKEFSFGNPQLELYGNILETRVDLETLLGKKRVPRIKGQVALSRGATLTLKKKGAPFWEVRDVTGFVSFAPEEGISLGLAGDCKHKEHLFGLKAKGLASVFDENQASIDLDCRLTHLQKDDAVIKLVGRQMGELFNSAEIIFKNFGKEEFEIIQAVFGASAPSLDAVVMREGTIDAAGIAYLQDYRLSEVRIDKIIAEGLKFTVIPLDLDVDAVHTSGDFYVDLSNRNPLETIDSNFTISSGELTFSRLNGAPWRLSGIDTAISVRKGVPQKSELKGNFAGMNGKVIVDWASPKEFMTLDFSGSAAQLTTFLPEMLKQGAAANFSQDHVRLHGVMKWIDLGAQFSGQIEMNQTKVGGVENIVFGFDIEKSSEKLWQKWPADDLAASYWENVGLEAMQKSLPPITYPALLFEANWIKAETGIAGMVVRRGWFQADNLSLSRYVSPFLFPAGQMTLKGQGSFKGVFNHNSLAVEYQARDAVLENTFLTMEAKQIGITNENRAQTNLSAAHYFDFDKGVHFGSLPLKQATYFEKNSGLLFGDVSALVIFEGSKLHFTDLSTQCNGVAMGGAIDLEFGLPDDAIFNLVIRPRTIRGTLSQIKHLFAHFNPELFILNIPLDGEVSLAHDNSELSFSFRPNDYSIEAKIQGSVRDAAFEFDYPKMSVKDVKLDFAYNHGNKSLHLTHINGNLSVGEGDQKSRYTLSGEYIKVLDYSNDLIEFDIWLGDQNRDLIRLVGKTLPVLDKEGNRFAEFHIDHTKTHFGNQRLANFQLIVQDWMTVSHFQVGFDLALNEVLSDMKLWVNSGLFSHSKSIGNEISSMQHASGKARVDLSYSGTEGKFSYNIHGTDISASDYAFKDAILSGSKKGESWSIDEFRLDNLMVSVDFASGEKSWDIKRMHLNYSNSLNMELTGAFLSKENRLEAHVNAMTMDLAAFDGGGEFFDVFVKENAAQGVMKATGNLKLQPSKHSSGWQIEAILNSSLQNWSLCGLRLQDVQNVSCHYVSDRGITFRNLDTSFIDPESGVSKARFQIEKVHSEFLSGELSYENFHFQVPSHHLPWLADRFSKSFPSFFTEEVADVLKNAKLQGSFDGTIQYEMNPPYIAFQIALKDGKYQFLNGEHEVRDFVLDYDPFEFKVSSRYLIGKNQVWMDIRSNSPTLGYGELILAENTTDRRTIRQAGDALFINWENDSDTGLSIRRAKGTFSGLRVDIERDPFEPLSENAIHCTGLVEIDAKKALPFFPEEMEQKLKEWKIGDGYQLEGKWRFQKDRSEDYAAKFHFQGAFKGQEFDFNGYRFNALSSQLEYTPNAIRLRDLNVNDESGSLLAEKVEILKGGDGHWYFTIPEVKIEKFRPSMLCETGSFRPTSGKPLVIRNLQIKGVQGSLKDSKSMIGSGELFFTNRSKKLLQNTIFQIPADIISRIGLDPSVMTPVTGSIEYTIKDGRIYLTRFKNIYSDSKLSKFHLSNMAPSYLDFEGNLHVQIRMKQHNLLFKLAELFTVNIGGNLVKPTYSLNKSPRDVAGP